MNKKKPFTEGCSETTATPVACAPLILGDSRPVKLSPLLFSTAMVKAILEGRKTQTRRVIKKGTALEWLNEGFTPEYISDPGNAALCPWGTAGDVIWVRETFNEYKNQFY